MCVCLCACCIYSLLITHTEQLICVHQQALLLVTAIKNSILFLAVKQRASKREWRQDVTQKTNVNSAQAVFAPHNNYGLTKSTAYSSTQLFARLLITKCTTNLPLFPFDDVPTCNAWWRGWETKARCGSGRFESVICCSILWHLTIIGSTLGVESYHRP